MFDAMQEPPPRTTFYALKTEMGEMTQQLESLTVWGRLAMWVTPGSRDRALANLLTWLLTEPIDFGIRAPQYRLECSENLHRLALAILLHQYKHGTMPGEDWAVQIQKYLGDNPEQYFSCPKNPAAEGKTTYALVLYGDEFSTDADTLLLIELAEPVPFAEAVITADEILERRRWGSLHSGQVIVAHRSGAVRRLWQGDAEEELLRMLGREKSYPQMGAD